MSDDESSEGGGISPVPAEDDDPEWTLQTLTQRIRELSEQRAEILEEIDRAVEMGNREQLVVARQQELKDIEEEMRRLIWIHDRMQGMDFDQRTQRQRNLFLQSRRPMAGGMKSLPRRNPSTGRFMKSY